MQNRLLHFIWHFWEILLILTFFYQSCHKYHIRIITWDTDPLIVSYPNKINVSKNIELYTGETIKLNFSVTDCNATASACVAYVFIGCADTDLFVHTVYRNATILQLAGPVSVFLSSGIRHITSNWVYTLSESSKTQAMN